MISTMKQKKCTDCGETKDVCEFNHKTKTQYSSKCKKCNKEYQKQYYVNNKDVVINRNKANRTSLQEWLSSYKQTLKCSICDETHPACLDFHHLKDKEFNIADAIRLRYSIKRVKKEIEKCEVLCANCHRKLHWYESRTGRLVVKDAALSRRKPWVQTPSGAPNSSDLGGSLVKCLSESVSSTG